MLIEGTARDGDVTCALRATVEHFSHESGLLVGLRSRPDPDSPLLASQRLTLDRWVKEAVVQATRSTGAAHGARTNGDVAVRTVGGMVVLYPTLGTTWMHRAAQAILTMFGRLKPTDMFVEPFVVADVRLDIRADGREMDRVLDAFRTALSREGRVVAFDPTIVDDDAPGSG